MGLVARRCWHGLPAASRRGLRAARCVGADAGLRLGLRLGQSRRQSSGASFKRPQLDIRAIVADPEGTAENARARSAPESVVESVSRIVELHGVASELSERELRLRTERKQLGKLGRSGTEEERATSAERGKQIKTELAELNKRRDSAETEMTALAAALPNSAHPSVPRGGEDANVSLGCSSQRGGTGRRVFDFAPKDHVEIGASLGLFDFESAATVSGSKFVYMTGHGALLELALVNFAMQRMSSLGYTPILTPDLVKQSVVAACGFAPRGPHTQIYSVEGSDLALAATAEAPLAGMWSGQRISREQLPIKQVGFSHCFRTEVGARGADVRGLYRLHQFSKVELFVIATPEHSDDALLGILSASESLLQELGLACAS